MILSPDQKLYPKDAKIYLVADWLIKEKGYAISWHVRSVLKDNGINNISTPMVNYYMKRAVSEGRYCSETLKHGQGVEYKLSGIENAQ